MVLVLVGIDISIGTNFGIGIGIGVAGDLGLVSIDIAICCTTFILRPILILMHGHLY
jgi:hypothetical protein